MGVKPTGHHLKMVYRTVDEFNLPITIITRAAFKPWRFITIIIHNAYGMGTPISVSFCATYNRAVAMHQHWIKLLTTSLPDYIVGRPFCKKYLGEVIYPKGLLYGCNGKGLDYDYYD